MRIAIISDIHSNLAALEAVLNKIDSLSVDSIYCLGDIVGYGPFPLECIGIIRERCSLILQGNHDSGAAGDTPLDDFNDFGRKAIIWTREQLAESHLKFLKDLPLLETRDDMTFVHSSPAYPERWTYIITMSNAREAFGAFTTRFCWVGHTHVPVAISDEMSINTYDPGENRSTRYIINVGSVGQPRDGNPDASFATFDTTTGEYTLHRVPYDIQQTADSILKNSLPDALARRLFKGV